MIDVPGHDCEQIGARFAVVIRRILGLYVDGATMDSRIGDYDQFGFSENVVTPGGPDEWQPENDREITQGGPDKWRPKTL